MPNPIAPLGESKVNRATAFTLEESDIICFALKQVWLNPGPSMIVGKAQALFNEFDVRFRSYIGPIKAVAE